MIIHIVSSGDTISSISQKYGVSIQNLIADNALDTNQALVIGQALAVQIPNQTYIIKQGDTLFSVAQQFGTTLRQLIRNNLQLAPDYLPQAGDGIIINYQDQGTKGEFVTNSYAYPYINDNLLKEQLPYLSYFTPFTYGITQNGGLVDLDDSRLINLSNNADTLPLMHLSTLTEEGGFSNERASMIFNDETKQNNLINEIINIMNQKGYKGLDVDFEFIYPEERFDYINFLQNLRLKLNPLGYPLFSALAPKTSDTQMGVLYEGHDYSGIGAATNAVLLMTYEWGYTYGPAYVKNSTIKLCKLMCAFCCIIFPSPICFIIYYNRRWNIIKVYFKFAWIGNNVINYLFV